MITKAIIEEVNTKVISNENLYVYTVRLPIFHGYGSTGVPTTQLPQAVYCVPPHMEQTQLSKDDVVYVAIEDFDLSSIVILGVIPVTSTRGLSGSAQTRSQVVLNDVQTFGVTREGSVELPFDIKIYTSTDDMTIEGINRNYVNGTELSYLKFLEAPIQYQINNARYLAAVIADKFNLVPICSAENVTITEFNKSRWIQRSGHLEDGFNYEFKHIGNNRWKLEDELGNSIIYTEAQLNYIGISYSGLLADAKISVKSNVSPLRVEYGGTGSNNAVGARTNLEVFKDVAISSAEFNVLESSGNLTTNTVYYIYD